MKEEVNIYNETISRFEFENFQVQFVAETKTWFLDWVDEEKDEITTIILEHEGESFFEENRDRLERIGFFQKDFDTLKSFINKKEI